MADEIKLQKERGRRLAGQRLADIDLTLSCGSQEEQKELLTALCPCRNRRYDVNVWAAIFRAMQEGETGAVRDQAGHAIGTLRERAKTDPRTQELMRKLHEIGVVGDADADYIPDWRPHLRGDGLYIPRFEKSARSKVNRRR